MKNFLFLYIFLSSFLLLGQNESLPKDVSPQQKIDYMYTLKISNLGFHIIKKSEGICHNEWNIKFINRINHTVTTIYDRTEQHIDNLEGTFFSNSGIIGISYYAKSTDNRRCWPKWCCDQDAIINVNIDNFEDLKTCKKYFVDSIGRHGGNEVRNKLSFPSHFKTL